MAFFSFSLSARLVTKFGIKRPLVAGLLLAGVGLLLFSRMPVDAHFITDILPGMILLGIGAGIAFNPVLLAAMNDVRPDMMGGALGLAILASFAASRTSSLLLIGANHTQALASGYHVAFFAGGVSALIATILAVVVLVSTPLVVSSETSGIL
jgi:MFS family permease